MVPDPRDPRQRRPGTLADRDQYQPKHAPTPTFIDDDATGRHDRGELNDEELSLARGKRPTHVRIGKVENKVDGVIAVTNTMTGKLDTLVELAAAAAVEREKRAAAEERERDKRAAAEAVERTEAAKERDSKRKYVIALIGAVATAAVAIIAALVSHA